MDILRATGEAVILEPAARGTAARIGDTLICLSLRMQSLAAAVNVCELADAAVVRAVLDRAANR